MLNQRATILADAILDIALILNPGLILLGGEAGSHPALLHEARALLKGSEFAVLRLAIGTLGIPAVLLGAVAVGLAPAIPRLMQAPRQR